jgi:hypothetical protein
MHVDQCVCALRAVELPVLSCLSNKCSEVGDGRTLNFYDIHSHELHAKVWGHCECNPAVPCRAMLNVSTQQGLRPASAQKCGGTIIIKTAQHYTFEFIQRIIFIFNRQIKMLINDALILYHTFQAACWARCCVCT